MHNRKPLILRCLQVQQVMVVQESYTGYNICKLKDQTTRYPLAKQRKSPPKHYMPQRTAIAGEDIKQRLVSGMDRFAARITHKVEDQDGISDRTAQNWFKKFISGDTSLQVQLRTRRPFLVEQEALKHLQLQAPENYQMSLDHPDGQYISHIKY
ncbi:hypothetical protein ILUMI_23270 [Ignelater luminosus]|uniref:Transposase n=1 Tax=Ignelater luminosus TaxID=2038154 RepID=A0A8K0C8F8_IGNLU|nr:hypothetical protein ILUMI_23270 [Ignelater luminosus]